MESSCGFCGFRPKFLQRFATPRSFMVTYGLLGTTQAMAYIYFVVSLTTMERRFKIPSKTTGIMLSGNELSQILLSLFLSYFGGSRNRPRWISWGVMLCSVSCFILALPHFIYGAGEETLALTAEYVNYYHSNATIIKEEAKLKASLCFNDKPVEDCAEFNLTEWVKESSLLPVLLVFISQFVLGIGNTLYYSLGNTYMDDNTKKTSTPMMLGYACALRTLGPAFGFILGPLCLSIFVEPTLTPLITKDDARWIGAWWLGWIILGIIMFLFSFLVGMFPKNLPKQTKINEKEKDLPQYPKVISITDNKMTSDEAPLNKFPSLVKKPVDLTIIPEPIPVITIAQNNAPTMKELPKALARLLKNKILMANIISGVFYVLGSSAYITFIAKYIEVQYNRSAASSTVVAGPVTLIGMVLGFLMSGWIISKKQPKPRYLLLWNVICGFIYLAGELSFMFLSCPKSEVELQIAAGRSTLLKGCNEDCMCDAVKYEPVCHEPTGQEFFSACHAGCSLKLPGALGFSNCSCIEVPVGANATTWDMIKAGTCGQSCLFGYYMFIIISMVINILGSSGRIGNILINYRCVEPRDKSFSQGLLLLLMSLCALIPGPIIYGAIIDATCVEWAGKCAHRTNCLLYDRDKFRHYINIAALLFTSFAVLFDIAVWHLSQNVDLYGDKDGTVQTKIPRKSQVVPSETLPEKPTENQHNSAQTPPILQSTNTNNT